MKYEIGRTCSMNSSNEKCIQNMSENGSYINKVWAGFCEHDNEPLVSIQSRESDYMSDYQFLKTDSVPWS